MYYTSHWFSQTWKSLRTDFKVTYIMFTLIHPNHEKGLSIDFKVTCSDVHIDSPQIWTHLSTDFKVTYMMFTLIHPRYEQIWV